MLSKPMAWLHGYVVRCIEKRDGTILKKVALAFMIAVIVSFSGRFAAAAELPVTSPFGWRVHPISGDIKFHAGIDLGYDYGVPINALWEGQIIQAGDYGDGYGNQVLMYHPSLDCYTRYGHMHSITVEIGQFYAAGTIIGYVGSTGASTGPHLHLEYIVPDGNGGYTYTDPLLLWP